MKRLVIVPDIHVPYQNMDGIAEVVKDCKKANHVVFLGDVLDAYPVMSHLKNPARKHTLRQEVSEAKTIIKMIHRSARGARIDFIEGNHEDRLRRYIWKNAPDLHDLVPTIPELLDLDILGINYHSQDGFTAYNRRFKHGNVVRNKSAYSANAEMNRHRLSGFSAHTHRMGWTCQTDAENVTTEWWECGHLVLPNSAEYVSSPDWQAGYLVAEVARDNSMRIHPIRL